MDRLNGWIGIFRDRLGTALFRDTALVKRIHGRVELDCYTRGHASGGIRPCALVGDRRRGGGHLLSLLLQARCRFRSRRHPLPVLARKPRGVAETWARRNKKKHALDAIGEVVGWGDDVAM